MQGTQKAVGSYQSRAHVTVLEQSQGKLSPAPKSKKLTLVKQKVSHRVVHPNFFCSFSVATLAFQ